MKISFLDRDGTIVSDYSDDEWRGKVSPDVLEDALEGMRMISQLGFEIIIVTNQYIINEGIITLDEYNLFSQNLTDIFEEHDIKILDIFFCPHTTAENCNCKKPKTGMIHQALQKYPQIDLANSFVIGDTEADEILAMNMNLKFYRIDPNLDKSYKSIKDVVVKSNLKHLSHHKV